MALNEEDTHFSEIEGPNDANYTHSQVISIFFFEDLAHVSPDFVCAHSRINFDDPT